MKASGDKGQNIADCCKEKKELVDDIKLSGLRKIREKNKSCYRGRNKGGIKMPYNSKTLGLVIGTERVKKGMTQEQLSGLAGISRSHLAALECGQKSPRVDTLWQIAEALSVKPSKLILLTEKNLEKGND